MIVEEHKIGFPLESCRVLVHARDDQQVSVTEGIVRKWRVSQ